VRIVIEKNNHKNRKIISSECEYKHKLGLSEEPGSTFQ
jgi:hypothetical protein